MDTREQLINGNPYTEAGMHAETHIQVQAYNYRHACTRIDRQLAIKARTHKQVGVAHCMPMVGAVGGINHHHDSVFSEISLDMVANNLAGVGSADAWIILGIHPLKR